MEAAKTTASGNIVDLRYILDLPTLSIEALHDIHDYRNCQ